ncbi:MAG: 2-succinyl-5-enolpyruvyl-6-hydroxy-3-cyclohexene-1-carboxylic-acid synthase [Solirubrobacterales bacterium]
MIDANTNTALSSVFAEELARCGVKLAVVSPGSRSTPLAIALYRQVGIEVRVVLDERSAGFFALGAAASGSEPVVLLCTSGTAAANYHPAVAEADLSAVPLIILTADRPPELRDIGAGQTIDQIKLFGSAVRWFSEVGTHEADDSGLLHLRATACRAYWEAAGQPRPGPVHLNVAFRDPLDPTHVAGSVTATDPLAIEGRPERPLTAVAPFRPSPNADEIARINHLVASAHRVLIVAGRQDDPSLRQPVTDLAARIGAPILAEPTSQLRLGPHDRSHLISDYDKVAGRLLAGDENPDLLPDLVIRIGETPTSRNLRTWLAGLGDVSQMVIDPFFGWYEPSRIAELIIRAGPSELLDVIAPSHDGESARNSEPGPVDQAYLSDWIAASEGTGSLKGQAAPGQGNDEDRVTPANIHRALGSSYRDGDLVYTASSLAIREQETFLPGSDFDVLFFSNRGANGIDGVIASGIGAAHATGRATTIVTGELGFQHDLGSLALLGESPVPVRIVIINDNGGRIFSRLPQKASMPADEFEVLMSAPGKLDIKAAAELFRSPYLRISSAAELLPSLASQRTGLIEVVLERD